MKRVEDIDQGAMLGLTERWAGISSGTGNLPGLAEMARSLAEAFSALPGDIALTDPAPVEAVGPDGTAREAANGQHLVLRVRPRAERRVLLTGHMDTVYPADSSFETLRWIDGETLNGPGVADMKGGLAVILHALLAFESTPEATALGYDVLINSDEETGSLSSAGLIAELARDKIAALTYEPSALPDGTLAGARGGSGNWTVTIRGKSAHAGRNPTEGRNAIVAAADLALRLKALDREGLRINPAKIDGGSGNNVVPDLAVLRFNIRPGRTEDAEAFLAQLPPLIDEIEATHEVRATLQGGISRPPKPIDARAEALFALVARCASALGQHYGRKDSGGVCDGNNIAAQGVPVVDTMGVRGGAIHSPDEFLIVPSLAERAALSANVLIAIARGEEF